MTETELLLLNVANAALGIVTVVFVAIVAWGVVSELWGRFHARAAAPADHHVFAVPELGLTMADGGEHVDEKKDES